MPHPARSRSFDRTMSRAEFRRHYAAELQEIRELKARGVDTSVLEVDVRGAMRDHLAGQPVRDVFERGSEARLLPEVRAPR